MRAWGRVVFFVLDLGWVFLLEVATGAVGWFVKPVSTKMRNTYNSETGKGIYWKKEIKNFEGSHDLRDGTVDWFVHFEGSRFSDVDVSL